VFGQSSEIAYGRGAAVDQIDGTLLTVMLLMAMLNMDREFRMAVYRLSVFGRHSATQLGPA
jgi:hypothetical protein